MIPLPKCSHQSAPHRHVAATKPMPALVNTQHRTSSFSKCSLKVRFTASKKVGAGSTGLGKPSRRRNGAGNSVVRRASYLKRHMLLISNVTRPCRRLVIWERATDDVNSCYEWLIRDPFAALPAPGKHLGEWSLSESGFCVYFCSGTMVLGLN